jgi:ferredoxin
MGAALRHGYFWPSVCQGDGDCGACFVVVENGAEHLSPVGPVEQRTIAGGPRAGRTAVRLACQVRLFGPVRVRKSGVRWVGTTR